jgi:hypothetical protein
MKEGTKMEPILRNEIIRKAIGELMLSKFDIEGREIDLEYMFEYLSYIGQCVKNNREQIVLKDLDLWEKVVNVIEVSLEVFGYKVDDSKSNYDEHIWIAVKQVTVDPKV